MKKQPILFTISGAAEALHRDRATLVRALRNTKSDKVDGKRQLFTLKTIFDKLFEHELRSVGVGGSGKGKQITDEHVLLAKARREKIEQETAERAGKLLDRDAMLDLMTRDHQIVTERLLIIAAEVADRLEPVDVQRHELIRSAIYDRLIVALNELSAPAALIERSIDGGRRTNGNGADREGDAV
jgi:hypothetical protein